MLFCGWVRRAQQVILVFFHLTICFQFLLFWFWKAKTAVKKKDKSHQAEQETMNQTSSFPAYDEVLYESARHMVDKFSWIVPGWKGLAVFCMHSLFLSGWREVS